MTSDREKLELLEDYIKFLHWGMDADNVGTVDHPWSQEEIHLMNYTVKCHQEVVDELERVRTEGEGEWVDEAKDLTTNIPNTET